MAFVGTWIGSDARGIQLLPNQEAPQVPYRAFQAGEGKPMPVMKISSWQDVANALTEFGAPYDDGDCSPDGEATITRTGQASKITITLEWGNFNAKKRTKKKTANSIKEISRVSSRKNKKVQTRAPRKTA